MASVYTRRFLFDPGSTVLLNIESVNVLDLTPGSDIQGIGTGTVIVVGEFENGPLNTPTQVLSSTDFPNVWGALGYTVNGLPCQYPSAVQHFADGAIAGEFWNGNGFTALNGKQFAALIVSRVDTSIGAVQFNTLAYLTGAALFAYPMATGQILSLNVDGTTTSATFTGVPATVTGTGGTYPTTFAGGENVTLAYDGGANFTTYFQSGDQSIAQVVSRINGYAGFTFASNAAGQLKLTGLQGGTGGNVTVVSGSTGVLAKLGLTAATTAGTGNVANIAAVKFSEVQSVVQTAVTTVAVALDQNNAIRISNKNTPLTGALTIGAGTTATSLGFAPGASATAVALATAAAGQVIPAGTVVQDSGATNILVTTQDVPLTGSAGPYTARVRYAVDNGTGAGTTANAITVLAVQPTVGAFAVSNALPISPAMTESQVDAAYTAAINATANINSVAKTANIIFAARHSNSVRRALRTNAINASANGCNGRVACISPPLNTAPQVAVSTVAEPGVGAYRDQRTIYCYVGANTTVPLIQSTGPVVGGLGFTPTGAIDQTSDGWMASILSQLPPEENPGQDTPFTSAINSIELGTNVQNLQMTDYEAFKAAGIAALRFDNDNGIAIFQSGVTSVNPATSPALVRISRRRMADFIEDSIAQFATGFGKRLSTKARRKALANEIKAWLGGLLGLNKPGTQRIGGFKMDPDSGNTVALLQQGLYRIIINVQTLVSLDSIVLQCTIGDQVTDVDEVLPQAA